VYFALLHPSRKWKAAPFEQKQTLFSTLGDFSCYKTSFQQDSPSLQPKLKVGRRCRQEIESKPFQQSLTFWGKLIRVWVAKTTTENPLLLFQPRATPVTSDETPQQQIFVFE
jgi:hypothetical protein